MRRSKRYTNELGKLSWDYCDLTLTFTLKDAATQKMWLRVTAYYQGEYLYLASSEGLIMNHKNYSAKNKKHIS